MGVGTSLVVFAIGAVLRFAVTVTTTGFNVHTVGVILMIVGAVGFVLSLIFWGSWGGFGGGYSRRRTTYSTGTPVARYDAQTGQPVARYDAQTGQPLAGGTVVEEERRSTY